MKHCVLLKIFKRHIVEGGGISSELLKLIAGDISKCITLILNQSLHSGFFPDKLKIAKVTTIHKKVTAS